MPKNKTYKIGEDVFDIPENEVSDFLKDNPHATEVNSFMMNKDTFDIPVHEVDNFLKENPAAKPLKKKADSASVSTGSANGIAPGTNQGPKLGFDNAIEAADAQSDEKIVLPGTDLPVEQPDASQTGTTPHDITPKGNKFKQVKTVADFNEKYGTDHTPYEMLTGTNSWKHKKEHPNAIKEQEDASYVANQIKSLASGLDNAYSMILRTPSMVYNTFAIPQNLIAEATGADIGTNDDGSGALSKAADVYDAHAKELKRGIEEKYDKEISDYFNEGEYQKGFEKLGLAITESLPITIAIAGAGYAGAGRGATTIGGTFAFGSQKKKELDQLDIPESQKTINALATGFTEGLFEEWGTGKIGNVAAQIFKEKGKEAGAEFASKAFKSTYEKALRRFFPITAPVAEGVSEAETQFVQNAIDKYMGIKPDINLSDGVSDAFLVGMGSGAVISSPATASIILNKKRKNEVAGLEGEATQIKVDADNPNVSSEAKEILIQKHQDVTEKINDVLDKEKVDAPKYTPEEIEKVKKLSDKSDVIDKALIDPMISETSKKLMEEEKTIVDKELEIINKEVEKKEMYQGSDFITETGLQPGYYTKEQIDIAKKEKKAQPPVSGLKDQLVQANKVVLDKEGKVEQVKQNSGAPSQLFEDLTAITGNKEEAANVYLNLKEDEGDFKTKFADWENKIMAEYGRSGHEYSIEKATPDQKEQHANDFAWSDEKNGKPIIMFNDRLLTRAIPFKEQKEGYIKEVIDPEIEEYKSQGNEAAVNKMEEYKSLFEKHVNSNRDIKLHLIHNEMFGIMNQGKDITINDIENNYIRSVKEVARLNTVELAKDYFGEPMIYTHAGDEGITKFRKPGDDGYKKNDALTGEGIYFSRDIKNQEKYSGFDKGKPAPGKDIYYTFLKYKNAYYMDDQHAQAKFPLHDIKTITPEQRSELEKLGYDAVIKSSVDRPKEEVVVFEPDQVHIIGSYNNGLTDKKLLTPKDTKANNPSKKEPAKQKDLLTDVAPSIDELKNELKRSKTKARKREIQAKINSIERINKLQARENKKNKSLNFEPVTEEDHIENAAYGLSEESIANNKLFKSKDETNSKGQKIYPDMPKAAYMTGRVLKEGGRNASDIAHDLINEGGIFEHADPQDLEQKIIDHALNYPAGLKQYLGKKKAFEESQARFYEENARYAEELIPEDATDDQLADYDNYVSSIEDKLDSMTPEEIDRAYEEMLNDTLNEEDFFNNINDETTTENNGTEETRTVETPDKESSGEDSKENAIRNLETDRKELNEILKPKIPSTDKPETDQIIQSKILPITESLRAIFKGFNYIQDNTIGKVTRNVEKWVAQKVKQGNVNQNVLLRNVSTALTSYANGLPRTEQEISNKRYLTGGIKKAQYDMAKTIKDLHGLLDNDLSSLERIHEALDPDFYNEANPTIFKQGFVPATYQDLTDAEKKVFDIIRKTLDYVHNYNFALGFIQQDTYDKFKGKYVPRLYEPYEVPEEIQNNIDETFNHLSKAKKLDFSIFKKRKDVTDAMAETILKDPVYGMAKRLMQTDVNVAIRSYLNTISKDNLLVTRDAKKGFTQLNGKGYGALDGQYAANYIAEDLKGFFFSNQMMDYMYNAFKVYDRTKLRQFYKKYRTVFDPGVQLGNFTSNFVFAFIGGIDPLTYGKNLIAAKKEINDKGPTYDLLLENGIIDSDNLTHDIIPLVKSTAVQPEPTNIAKKYLKKFDDFASRLYANTDNMAKVSAYLSLREYGYGEQQAIQHVYDSFQNYATVGKIWDAASKTPIVGNPFVKFQADLQRILKNAALKRPLTTAAYYGMIYMLANLASDWSDEDDEQKRIRETREFIPKVKLGFADIPLTFQTSAGEVNLARYVSPYYIYDVGSQEEPIEAWSKLLPFKIRVNDTDIKENQDKSISTDDPLMGVWYATIVSDRDFRGKSISDPHATRYRSSGETIEEKIMNSANYVLRSQLPYWDRGQDMYLALTTGTDFYGRQRNGWQALLNNLVKVQEFGDAQYARVVENDIKSFEWDIKNLGQSMRDAYVTSLKQKQKKQELFENKVITQQVYEKFLAEENEQMGKRSAEILDKIAKKQSEFNEYTNRNKRFLPTP